MGVQGKCSASLYEDNLPNRAGLFANCCTQLRRYSNGHLHATVLMPQALALSIHIYTHTHLHAIIAILLVLLIKPSNYHCQWSNYHCQWTHTPKLRLGSFENLVLNYRNQRGIKELTIPFWFCFSIWLWVFFFISYHKSPSVLPTEPKRNRFHHFNTMYKSITHRS